MKLLENIPCVEVEWSENAKKVTLRFYDEEHGECRDVNFNKQSYKDGKYVDDPAKAEKAEQMFFEDTGLEWANADSMQDRTATVYDYGKFCSLHPVDIVEKFSKEMVGEVFSTEIKEIIDGDYAIRIRYEIDGKTYESKMQHGTFLENIGKWAKNPQKEIAAKERFEKKFGVPIEDADQLIGKEIMVEVKKAFQSYFGDIKKLPKKK